jgi:SAM-dependent methyltransferase
MPTESHSFWRARRYRSDADFVCGKAPPWLTDIAQALFRVAMMERIARHVAGRSFTHALDLGCGVGDWTAGYLSIAEQATGVDINDDFLGAARRRAAVLGIDDRIRFEASALEAFPIDAGIDFVGLGGCLMYLSDVEVNRLLARVAHAVPMNGLVYIRCSVAAPLHARHRTEVGIYRDGTEYETLFRANGLEVVDRAFSVAVVAEHIVASVGPPALRGMAMNAIAALGRADRAARCRTDFCNWLLRPAPAGGE